MTTAKLTLQTPAETALWTTMVQRLSSSQFMESAIEDADLAVLALRERMPAAAPEPAQAEPPADPADLGMHGLMVRAALVGATVRCTFADGAVAVGVPELDPYPYHVGAWRALLPGSNVPDRDLIVKVEIL